MREHPWPITCVSEVLIDLLEDNQRRLQRLFDRIDDECLHWRPDPGANSIALAVWHMARLLDVFMVQHAWGAGAEQECWFQCGWASVTGYDPRGIGREGWGSLNDYSPEQVAAVPRMTRGWLLGYLDDVYSDVRNHLLETSNPELQSPAPGLGGRFTRYQCIQMAVMDNVRHLGEILAIQARWERERGRDSGAPEEE